MSGFGSDHMEDNFTEQSLVALQGWGPSAAVGSEQDQSKRARTGTSKRDRTQVEKEPPLRDLVRAMGQLMLRHEQDLQSMAQQDTFIFYLVPSQEGSLPLLQAAHRAWNDQKERTTNLRTHLILTMLRKLQRRLLKLMSGADNDPIKVALVKNGILLEDHTWLIYNKTKMPVTMNVTQEMLEEMLTLVKEDGAIQKFHSLSKPGDSKSQPWRLQVGLRNDRLHKLFTQSCHVSLWQIIGFEMKPRSLKASPLALKVKDMMQRL